MEPHRDDRGRPFLVNVDPGSERGATAVEYALLVTFIATAVIATVAVLGGQVQGLFQAVQWW